MSYLFLVNFYRKKKNEEKKEGGKAENREGGFKDEC